MIFLKPVRSALLCWAGFLAISCAAQELPRDALTVPPPPAYNAVHAPVATHRFWAAKNWFATNKTATGGPYTMFPEPLAVQTTPQGLLVGYSPYLNVSKDFFVHPVQPDFTLGVRGLNAASVKITGSTDRMVDFDFGPIRTRVGRGMPFVYAEMQSADATVTFVSDPTVFFDGRNRVGVNVGGNHYGLFCPSGGRWQIDGRVFTCRAPGGHNYVSIALLPAADRLATYARYAFVFPVDTHVSWVYDSEKSQVSTTFEVITESKESMTQSNADSGFLQALYPHQYTALTGAEASSDDTYASARGPMRLLDAKRFTTVDSFPGLLPFLPVPAGFDAAESRKLLQTLMHEPEHFPGPDTYGQGKSFGRLAQLLPVAQASGDTSVGAQLSAILQRQFALWSQPDERKLHRFTYEPHWGTLIGYPASFGSNTQLNDHHFHYGYWINAAAMLALYDPAWLRQPANAAFVHELTADIATLTPNDPRYPMLRCFDAYAGHSWASGQAPFGDGENQESTSEAINAWAGIALFASETGNVALRDAAIWMYTLETNAVTDYWFNDGPVLTFPVGFERVQITNLFDGKADTATWFGNAPEFEHGIQFLPFTGASLYLGRDVKYVKRNLAEVKNETGGELRRGSNYWPDLMEMYEAFDDPRRALAEWRETAFVFDGESKAHEFAWLSSMAAYGHVERTIRANTTFYAVFRKDAVVTHIAFNPAAIAVEVRFTDGYLLTVPAHAMSTNGRLITLPD